MASPQPAILENLVLREKNIKAWRKNPIQQMEKKNWLVKCLTIVGTLIKLLVNQVRDLFSIKSFKNSASFCQMLADFVPYSAFVLLNIFGLCPKKCLFCQMFSFFLRQIFSLYLYSMCLEEKKQKGKGLGI